MILRIVSLRRCSIHSHPLISRQLSVVLLSVLVSGDSSGDSSGYKSSLSFVGYSGSTPSFVLAKPKTYAHCALPHGDAATRHVQRSAFVVPCGLASTYAFDSGALCSSAASAAARIRSHSPNLAYITSALAG